MEHDAVRFVLEKTVFVYETQRNFRSFEDTAIVKIHITKFIKFKEVKMNFSIAPAESPSSVRVNTEASLHKNIDQQHTVSAVGEYDVLEWLVRQPEKFVLSTSFGPYSPVLLHMISEIAPSTPVIWVDTGYNTESTYRFIENLKQQLNFDLHIYHPLRSVAHREALGEGSKPGDGDYEAFKNEVKLEPFRRALKEHAPRYWVTGIRSEESEYRKSLGVVSQGPSGIVKLAPLFNWNQSALDRYMTANNLRAEADYFDPTKLDPRKECGLHCSL